MKGEKYVKEEELEYKEQKDLVRYLRRKGYEKIFRLGRAFVVLERGKYKDEDSWYEEDVLKVILMHDPAMAWWSPRRVWKDRDELVIKGNKFGLSGVVRFLYSELKYGKKDLGKEVLAEKKREDYVKEVKKWIKLALAPKFEICYLEPGKEREYWFKKFGRMGKRFERLLEEYNLLVEECKEGVEKVRKLKGKSRTKKPKKRR